MPARLLFSGLTLTVVALTGCTSPYHSDQGAPVWRLVRRRVPRDHRRRTGHPGAGAAEIGAGVGTLSGAAIGSARTRWRPNRAMITQQLGRQISAGAVRVDDVIAMTRSGVNDDL